MNNSSKSSWPIVLEKFSCWVATAVAILLDVATAENPLGNHLLLTTLFQMNTIQQTPFYKHICFFFYPKDLEYSQCHENQLTFMGYLLYLRSFFRPNVSTRGLSLNHFLHKDTKPWEFSIFVKSMQAGSAVRMHIWHVSTGLTHVGW